MARRLEIQDYGGKIVLRAHEGEAGGKGEAAVVTLAPTPAVDSVDATVVFHPDPGLGHAFVGTDCGVFVVNTNTGKQVAQLLGNRREVQCFQAIQNLLYVGVKDKTEPSELNFGLWTIDMATLAASHVEKTGEWEVTAMTLNSKQNQMAATYCENVNGNFWFQVHLFGVDKSGSINYQQRIGEDGWGVVRFNDDGKKVIIDGREWSVPTQYLKDGNADCTTAAAAAAAAAPAPAAPAAAAPAAPAAAVQLGKRNIPVKESTGTCGNDHGEGIEEAAFAETETRKKRRKHSGSEISE